MKLVFSRIGVLPSVMLSARGMTQIARLSQGRIVTFAHWPPLSNPDTDDIDVLIAGWKDDLSAATLAVFPALRYIALRGTSTDRIDTSWAAEHGITVQPIYNYGDYGTAEFVIEQMLYEMRQRRRDRGAAIQELHGRRLGLFGYGNIGRKVGTAAAALGMRVLFHTPSSEPERAMTEEGSPSWAERDHVLASSDVLSMHTPPYRQVLTQHDLRRINDGALLIITTLGLPVPAEHLVAWQRSRGGRIVLDRCAITDASESMLDIPGIWIADFYAARTEESVERAELALLNGLQSAIAGSAEPPDCTLTQR